MKRLTLYFLLLLSCIGAARFTHHQTKGFRCAKVRHNLPLFSTDYVLAGDEKAASQILSQKFHFFARGLQSFAFISEDGEYILKLFNNTHQTRSKNYRFLKMLFPPATSWALHKETVATSKLVKAFNSYRIAIEEMQPQTALLYVHGAPTHSLPEKLTIIDPLNIEHQLNPNETGFLLQRRVELAYPTLQKLIDNNELTQAKQAIHSLVQLFTWKYQHHIADNDPLIRTNYGFIGTQAVQIDVGPLSHQETPLSQEDFHKELTRITRSLKHFLEPRSEELVRELDLQLEEALSS